MAAPDLRVAVVIIAMNACERIGRALTQLSALPEALRVVVVDNASTDGTAELIRRRFPSCAIRFGVVGVEEAARRSDRART